jgi:hypothetical protein
VYEEVVIHPRGRQEDIPIKLYNPYGKYDYPILHQHFNIKTKLINQTNGRGLVKKTTIIPVYI